MSSVLYKKWLRCQACFTRSSRGVKRALHLLTSGREDVRAAGGSASGLDLAGVEEEELAAGGHEGLGVGLGGLAFGAGEGGEEGGHVGEG